MPSPPTFVAGAEPPAPKLAPSSSIFVGSVVDALAGGRHVADPAKGRRLLLLNKAPPAPPFFPPLLRGAIRVRPLGPQDPGDATRDGTSRLDPRGEIMAEERRVGPHPGEAFAKMRKESHARHRIRSKIQQAKAEGVHNVAEEIGKRGA